MARALRYVPPHSLVEVTCRTLQGRFLLRPGRRLNELVVGALAMAQKLYPVRVHGVHFQSNHYHLLLSVDDAEQLAGFMNHVNSNIAREAGRLYSWNARFWESRYRHIVVSEEEPAQISRLKYLLAQGCKEGLIQRPGEWPGVQSAQALMAGVPLEGIWIDHSREYEARRRKGRAVGPEEFTLRLRLTFDPLPCWRHLSAEQIRARVAELVHEIEHETTLQHEAAGSAPADPATLLQSLPHHRPSKIKRSPAPRFHAFRREVRRVLEEAYRLFVAAFRAAAGRLRAGDLTVQFPAGSFPPARRFVGLSSASA